MSTATYYTYDNAHRLTSQYVLAGEAHYYSYNQRNFVTQIQDVGGAGDALRSCIYNALGERVVCADAGGTSTYPAYWSYDGRKFLQDKQLSAFGTSTNNYRHNDSEQACLASFTEMGLSDGNPAFVTADGGGSVSNIQDPNDGINDNFVANYYHETILDTNNFQSRLRTATSKGALEARTTQEVEWLPGGAIGIPGKNLKAGGPECGPGEDEDPEDCLDDLNDYYNCGDDDSCGPVATAWLAEEINLWMNYALDYRARTTTKDDPGTYIDALKALGGRPKHREVPFSGPDCPTGTKCKDTVTICETCLRNGELGNLIFGVIGSAFVWSWVRWLGQTWVQIWDDTHEFGTNEHHAGNAAISIGDDLGVEFTRKQWDPAQQKEKWTFQGLTAETLCDFLTKQDEWRTMASVGGGCTPCTKNIVPAKSDHTSFPSGDELTDEWRIHLPEKVTAPSKAF